MNNLSKILIFDSKVFPSTLPCRPGQPLEIETANQVSVLSELFLTYQGFHHWLISPTKDDV